VNLVPKLEEEEGSIMLNDVYTEEEKLAKPVSIVTTQQFQGLRWLPKIRRVPVPAELALNNNHSFNYTEGPLGNKPYGFIGYQK
jgi:hypothetical protein